MSEIKAKKSKYIFLFLRIVVIAAGIAWAITWLSREQRWENLKTIFSRMDLGVFVVTLGIFTISHMIVSLRWWLLLRTQSIFIGFWTAVKLYFLGWFYNNFMPSSVGGDLVRAWYVTTHTDKKFEAAMSVFVDRAIGFSGILIMAFCCYWFIPSGGVVEQVSSSVGDGRGFLYYLSEYKWFLVGAMVVVVLILAAFASNLRGRNMLGRVYGFAVKRGGFIFRECSAAIGIYYNKKLAILFALFLTFVCQFLAVVAIWIIGNEIGVDMHFKYYFIFFPISL